MTYPQDPYSPTDVPMPSPNAPQPDGPSPYSDPVIPTDVPMPNPNSPQEPPAHAPGIDPDAEPQVT